MATRTNQIGMNNSGGDSNAKTVASALPVEDSPAATQSTCPAEKHRQQEQSNEEISDFSDTQLKALLDEAITYKTPKDLAHKSETFKELLKRAETEEQSLESNFNYIPFTSSGGGSLQNIFESVNSEPRKYSSTGSSNPRRHHISGQSYGRHSQSHYHYSGIAGASGAGGGAGGAGGVVGGPHHLDQSHRTGSRGHGTGGGGSFVSSRQGEGGSLPSNVNTRSVGDVHPFIAEMEGPTRRRGLKNNNNSDSGGGRASDEYERVANGEPLSKAAARSVAARGTSVGYDTDIPYAQMASSPRDSLSVIINMGDSGSEEHADDQLVGGGGGVGGTKKVTSHQQLQQAANWQQQYRTNLKIDIEHSASGENESSTTSVSRSAGGGYEQMSVVGNATCNNGSRMTKAPSGVIRAEMDRVDSSLKLNLEPKCMDPLANAYMSVKNGRGDQKSEMIIVTPSSVVQSHDRELSTDLEWPRQVNSLIQQKKIKNKRKYERNMTTIVSDEIIGFRGEETDLDRLVQFIESKESEQQQQTGGRQPQDSSKKSKNKGTNKKEQHGGGKLKKSNSMNELRSCSKLDEITSEKETTNSVGGVLLRPKTGKNKNQSESNNSSSKSHGSSGEVKSAVSTGNKRGDRRSWGTEELQYLGEADVAAAEDSFIVDTNNNMSGLKKRGIIAATAPEKKVLSEKTMMATDLSIHTKTLGDLPVNSVSMESLVSSSWANEEFHVVTKKRKSKKKQNIVVQPFEVERRTASGGGNNKAGRSQNVEQLLGGSQKNAKNRPNNLIGSITNTSNSSNGGGGSWSNRPSTGNTGSSSLQPGQLKSRRKSTSSVPPSEHSDSSDLDSVHSLPIESPSANKSKSGTAKGGGGGKCNGAQGVSYADITKKAGSQKAPGCVGNNTNAAVSGGPTTGISAHGDDRDIKWPVIGGKDGEGTIENGKWVNGTTVNVGGGEERLQKMSDIIKNSHAAVMRSAEVINVAGLSTVRGSQTGAELIGGKTLLQKSKSVDNESSGFNMNIDQYPSLEKTVNKKTTTAVAAASSSVSTVVATSKESCAAMVPPSHLQLANGTAGKKSKLLSSIVSDSLNNNNSTAEDSAGVSSNVPTTISSNHVARASKYIQADSSSMANGMPVQLATSSTTNYGGEDTTGTSIVVAENSSESKMAVNSKSNNNQQHSPLYAPKDQPQLSKAAKSSSTTNAKSNRNRTSSMPQISTLSSSTATNQQQRPAVIILNDERYESDITFGFDVNNQLLFGDFEEDEIRFLEADVLLNESNCGNSGGLVKNVDQANTSDYNSYDSSLCSSSSATTTGVKSSGSNRSISVAASGTEELQLDSNNNPNDDTAEELEVPLVSTKPQSTPKQVNVANCSNCSRNNMPSATVATASGDEEISEGMVLMKNSCVQTSLDNLIMVPELNSIVAEGQSAVQVVTVSDLESRNSAVAMKQQALKTTVAPNWAEAELNRNGSGAAASDPQQGGANGEGFDTVKAKLQQFALINAQFARQAPMGWMCNQMNSFFNNHENVINFVGLAWEDLTHNKSNALKYYNGQ